MKIHSLKVRGAIGFKKGLGLDEVEVNFTGLSGLIALAGSNGRGKTTLLESLSPYRTFASRDGSMRHHFFLRDSFRDLTFEFGGDIYRTLVKIDSDSDRTEGFIWKNNEPQVDGKVTNYDRYINDLLGSSNLFYNSVFCAQNSAKISDLTTGQLKKLFVEFLRLDRLSGYEAAAKQCVTVLNGTSQQLQRNIDGLQERIDSFAGIEERIRKENADRDAMADRQAFACEQAKKQKEEIERLTEVQTRNSVNIERRDDLKRDIQTIRDEMGARYKRDLEAAELINKSLSEKQTQLKDVQGILADRAKILDAAQKAVSLEKDILAARQGYNDQGSLIENLYSESDAKGEEAHILKNNIQSLENDGALNRLLLDIDVPGCDMEASLANIESLSRDREGVQNPIALERIDLEIMNCREAMTLLEQRGDCPVENPTCAFVLSAVNAKDRLPDLEKERDELANRALENVKSIDLDIEKQKTAYQEAFGRFQTVAWEYHDLKEEINKSVSYVRTKIKDLEAIQTGIRESIIRVQDARREKGQLIDNLTSQLNDARKLAGRLPEIQKAESQVERLEDEIRALETTIQEKRDQYARDERQSKEKIQALEKRLAEVREKIDEKVAQKILDARAILESRELEKDNLSHKIKISDENLAILNQRLEEKAGVEKELARAQEELGRVTAESSQWLYLQNACGKSGLQALEIDGVAPLITGYANDLLTSSFGPNFSVNLITQDPETGKEVLDIVVIRGDGSETVLENLSGGEKVWVLKSQRLAMTLISKEKSGRNFQTILADEEDGPLDSEKAMSFIGLYKAILEVGGFNDCFFISHNPDVVAMADHWINFSENGIRVD